MARTGYSSFCPLALNSHKELLMKKNRGFTLIELLIAVAIAFTLVVVLGASIVGTLCIRNNRVQIGPPLKRPPFGCQYGGSFHTQTVRAHLPSFDKALRRARHLAVYGKQACQNSHLALCICVQAALLSLTLRDWASRSSVTFL